MSVTGIGQFGTTGIGPDLDQIPLPGPDIARQPPQMDVRFSGRRWPYFLRALAGTILTVLTLGLYRFWMKTRLRQFLWASVEPGGIPLEYHGNPYEKLLGFLSAVTVLAIYIGLVNLVLMFLSFSFFQVNVWAYVLSFLGILPLFWAAKYRARRYLLARTSWRGIHFGTDPGAWAYARLAFWNWFLTIISLGLLWPRMTFRMEKFRTDRTFWGDLYFHQDGSPALLRRYMGGPMVAIGFGLIAAALLYFGTTREEEGRAGLALLLAMVIAPIALVLFRVAAIRELGRHKRIGALRLQSNARPWRILRHYLLGGFLAMLLLVAFSVGLVFLLARLWPAFLPVLTRGFDATVAEADIWPMFAAGLVIYFSVFVLGSALMQVFVHFPNFRHYAATLVVQGEPGQDLSALDRSRQRENASLSQAEGFADALDLGAAF